MFCFETAFKLLCLSWVAYVDDVTPAGCERECTLQRMQQDAAEQSVPAGCVVMGGDCKCHSGHPTCREVCADSYTPKFC